MKLKPRNRQKRCDELSCLYLWQDERYNDGSWSLVQGAISSGHVGTYDHAWLISQDGRVYDPVRDKTYAVAEYEAEFQADAVNIYSLEQSERLGGEHGHYGPWALPAWVR
jgi:hypothetical protein